MRERLGGRTAPAALAVTGLGLVVLAVLAFLAGPARAAYLVNVPQEVTQPDGTVLNLLATGDEYYNWLHDAAGFVILRDPASGWLVFADKVGGSLVPTCWLAGRDDPGSAGLLPGLKPDAENLPSRESLFPNAPGLGSRLAENAPGVPRFSAINNLVIFIRFSDQVEFGQALSAYDTPFNSTAAGVSSMRGYFAEASYGKLAVTSTFYPAPSGSPPSQFVVSYQDSHPRGYYMPYDATTNTLGYTGGNSGADRTAREHALLANAVNWVNANSPVPAGLNVDSDGDGRVDNVVFYIQGATSAWASLLWPHRWSLYSQVVSINGKRVYDYNLQLSSWIDSSVLSHEMTHTLGAPDLYRYTNTAISPVGSWDLMDNNGVPPQHSGAWMKYRYMGWIPSIPSITADGTYSLNPITSQTQNAFQIASPNSSRELFVVEYRKKAITWYEKAIPDSGLLVYRINTSMTGNAGGPPDEVYLYRPGGTNDVNGTVNSAAYSIDLGRTAIDDQTSPSSFLSTGGLGRLSIFNVGTRGATISFQVGIQSPCTSLVTASSPAASGTVQVLTPGNCTGGGYLPGTVISLLAVPGAGKVFRTWAGNGGTFSSAGATATTFTVGATGDLSATATYYVAPFIRTEAATSVTAAGATLNAGANASDAATTTGFDYGLTTAYGYGVDSQSLSGTVSQMISAPVTGLLCGQTYHFRARGTNVAGTTYGSDLTFQTLSCPGAAFYTLQSCRILDTRNASGPDAAAPSLSASQERVFDTATVTRCGIPASARALVVNVAAVSAAAQGSLALFPGGTTWPGNSSLSFNAGQTRSNNTVASLGGSGGLTVRNGSTGIVHIVVDVFGYFQ